MLRRLAYWVCAVGVGASLGACGDGSTPAADADSGGGGDAAVDGEMVAEDGGAVGDGAVGDAADGSSTLDSATGDPLVTQLSVVSVPQNTLARWVDYRTEEAVQTDVRVTCGDAYEQRFTAPARKSHSVFVMGLVPEVSCELQVWAADELQQSESFDVVGPDGWPSFSLEVHDESATQPGWTLFNLTNTFDGTPARIALVDALGRLRWYYQLPTTQVGADTEVALVNGGVIACGRLGSDGPFLVGWEGSVLWQPRLGGHHDCRFVDESQQVFRNLIDAERCEGEPGAGVIQDIDRDSGEVLWEWAMCEHYTPAELVADWSHVNAIESFPDEDALLISSREQHALFKISRATGDVLWKLGLDGDFAHAGEDAFWAQHAPEILPDGHILLFDNGRDEPDKRASSRVIEVAYDVGAMTYEVVWEYEPTPSRFNPIWGDSDRLDNGNTLATFGARSTTETSDLYEVDAAGTLVWQLKLPVRWGVYRADRVTPYFGHAGE